MFSGVTNTSATNSASSNYIQITHGRFMWYSSETFFYDAARAAVSYKPMQNI